jgi:Uma2 family endonuclease
MERMAVPLKHYRFTRDEYHRMVKAGILHEDSPVELIDGEILEMSPIGRRHKVAVDRLNDIFVPAVRSGAIVRVQSSIVLGDYGEPEPDLVLLRRRDDFYADADETPEDILLIIEVADSSEAHDRQVKVPVYARFNILEVWVASLNGEQIFLYRDPTPNGYATTLIARRGDVISPLAFPDLKIAVNSILG